MHPAYPVPIPPTLTKVFVAFHISAAVYFLLGLAAMSVVPISFFARASIGAFEMILIVFMGGFSLLLGVGVEVVIWNIKKGKHWAWIAGICIAGIYIGSGFLPLGIIALVGLLDNQAKAFCSDRPPAEVFQ